MTKRGCTAGCREREPGNPVECMRQSKRQREREREFSELGSAKEMCSWREEEDILEGIPPNGKDRVKRGEVREWLSRLAAICMFVQASKNPM